MKPVISTGLFTTALLSAASATPAAAALSDYYDSAEKIGTILSSSIVTNAVRQAPIGVITNTGTREAEGLWALLRPGIRRRCQLWRPNHTTPGRRTLRPGPLPFAWQPFLRCKASLSMGQYTGTT